MNKQILITLATLLAAASAQASVFECTDASGRKVYTQNAGKNCRSSNLGKPSVYSSAPVSVSRNEHTAAPEATVAENADAAAARRSLAQAQKALEAGKQTRLGNERNYAKYLERVQGLEKQVKAAEQKLRAAEQGAANGAALGAETELR